MPGGQIAHRLLQRQFGSLEDWSFILDRLTVQARMAREWLQHAGTCNGIRVVEIGTGWTPVIPFGWWLCGAANCDTFDLNRHLDSEVFTRVVEQIARHEAEVTALYAQVQPAAVTRARLRDLRPPFGIEYHAPADATATGLPSSSFEVQCSNSVLEHVAPEMVSPLIAEAARLLRPGGLTMQFIDPSDHFAHYDDTISRVNFVQFDDDRWRRLAGNRFAYHNRLREPDWRAIFEGATEFETLELTSVVDDRSLRALPQLTLDPRFARFTAEQVAREQIFWVARRR